MGIVKLSNGKYLEVPDGMSRDEIKAALNKKFPKKTPQQEEQSFLSKLPRNIGAGLAEAGRNILNIPHALGLPHAGKYEPTDFSKTFGITGEPTQADKLIQALAQHSLAFAAPEMELGAAGKLLSSIPKVGKYAKSIVGQALPVAAFEATQAPENAKEAAIESAKGVAPFAALSQAVGSANPYLRLGGRAALAGAGALTGYHGAKALGADSVPADALGAALGSALGLAGINPKISARQDLLKGIHGTDYKSNLEAANRLGLSYLTPAEASKNPFAGALQGDVGRTEKGAKALYEAGQKRLQSEEGAIGKLMGNIYNPTIHDEQLSQLYKKSYNAQAHPLNMEEFKDNEVVKHAEKVVQRNPAFKESLKNVPKDSLEYWDNIKRALDDMGSKAERAGENSEARILNKTKNAVINKLDEASPFYKDARALAERQKARQSIEDVFNKKEMIGTNLYSGLLNNKSKFNKLYHHLRNVPEAQQQLKDMRQIFGDLINPPSVRTAAALSRSNINKERNTFHALATKFKNALTKGKYDSAAVELITNPKWQEELSKINELTGLEKKLQKTFQLLGKANAIRKTSEIGDDSE